MRLKYNGLEPVVNFLGEWKHGDIKQVLDGFILKWENFELLDVPKHIFVRKKIMREELKDKLERDNKEILIQGRIKK
jgi:hypothetical protein